jgi:hypothetical protein
LTYLTFSRSARRAILAATGSARSFAPGNSGVSQRRDRVCFLVSREESIFMIGVCAVFAEET